MLCLTPEGQDIPVLHLHIRDMVDLSQDLCQGAGQVILPFVVLVDDRSPSSDVDNPGNNLYVTGLSPRMTKRELEKHFATEGKVVDVHLVVDPWTRESRGFGFVTMSTVEEADRCIKYLNRSVVEGRVITVEKARRRRGRTPTPGRYLGLRTIRVRRRTPSYSPSRRTPSYSPSRRTPSYSPRRSPSYSPYRRSLSGSSRSSDRSRSRSYSPYYRRRRRSFLPYYRRRRSYSPYESPYYRRRRSYSPYDGRRRSYSRSLSPYSRSPVSRRDRSYSPYSRDDSPYEHYYGRRYRYRFASRSVSPRARRRSRRSYSRSVSPKPRRSSRRSYSPSVSPRQRSSRRSYSPSVSPSRRRSKRSYSPSISHSQRLSKSYRVSSRRDLSQDSYSRSSRSRSLSRSVSASSRSVSRSISPRCSSPTS
ncbi:hypothetical protein FEM48_Zijuj02G0059000 [Ziziphus jujuba var. spinosa]|uniref:RRM domain-containing protein n=1 Tax=Ziziphus jujuba var. spinosa TaxID=714518 RepID=A0A978VU07_ZIZJJ|nr:hypothetical protein FEM48_Zijuj02G0059000 [Ziziphus jujuba var. spinosa]